MAKALSAPRAITSSDIKSGIERYTGEFYRPQSTAGDYARTLGQFASSSIAGPGTLGQRLATGTAAALGSEAAGQLTRGTALDPYARIAGGFATGLRAGAGQARRAERAFMREAPTTAELETAKRTAYQRADALGATIKPDVFAKFASQTVRGLGKFYPEAAPQSAIALRVMQKEIGNPLTVQNLEGMRSTFWGLVQTAKRAGNENDERIVKSFIRGLDQLQGSIRPQDLTLKPVMSGQSTNARAAHEAYQEARRLNVQWRKSQTVEGLGQKEYAAGYEEGVRQQARNALNQTSQTTLSGFTHEERNALRRVAHGTTGRNLTYGAGKMAFTPNAFVRGALSVLTAGGAGALASGGSLASAILPAAAIAGTGYAARKLAESLARRDLGLARAMAATGKRPKVANALARNLSTAITVTTPFREND